MGTGTILPAAMLDRLGHKRIEPCHATNPKTLTKAAVSASGESLRRGRTEKRNRPQQKGRAPFGFWLSACGTEREVEHWNLLGGHVTTSCNCDKAEEQDRPKRGEGRAAQVGIGYLQAGT